MSSTTRSIILTGANGDSIDLLNDQDYELGVTSNLFSPQRYAYEDKPLAGFAGSFKAQTRVLEKVVNLPIVVKSASELEHDQKMQRLAAILNATAHCHITHVRDDNTSRVLYVQYRGGADLAVVENYLDRDVLINLVFNATRPHWFEVEEQQRETLSLVGIDSTNGVVWGPTLTGTIAEVWPRWTVTGVADNLEIIDTHSARHLRIKEVLTNADEVVIDTNPRHSGVFLNNQYLHSVVLDDQSVFFPLRPGFNRLIVKCGGGAPRGELFVEYENAHYTP